MADIWSEKNVGFIGPVKFLSDLTVGPTYFTKSVFSASLAIHVFQTIMTQTRWFCSIKTKWLYEKSPPVRIFNPELNQATELKRGNPERTLVSTDIWSWTMADIWSEKNVGFIGPVKFLSDLTVGPTYFTKSVFSASLAIHVFQTLMTQTRWFCSIKTKWLYEKSPPVRIFNPESKHRSLISYKINRYGHGHDVKQCCRNTLEFCQTSVWQNSRFCRTKQNFVRPNFFIKPIVLII